MSRPFKFVLFVTIFWSGFMICANLVELIEYNRNYPGSWWSVFIFIVIAIIASAHLYKETEK